MKINAPSPPKINRVQTCRRCRRPLNFSLFPKTNSPIFGEDVGVIDICGQCVTEYLKEKDYSWEEVDRLCRYADIPFIPREFERIKKMNPDGAFLTYSELFSKEEYKGLDWKIYNDKFLELEKAGTLEDELPLIADDKRRQLQEKWGANYDDEALRYLEKLYNGILATQNVNGVLQGDQALKLCRISYEIDSRIREGADFDKVLASYDKLAKVAEFTPKNVKNINDFDTMGELIKWFEKKGWKNNFYDGATRDIVDETIKNIQSFNQRLYINESGIGDEISRRIEALKSTKELEDNYSLNSDFVQDEYENDGYKALFKEDDFNVDFDGEGGESNESKT